MKYALAAALIAQTALAQPFPVYYDVRGVNADDVLNVRSQPSTRAEKIGALPPDAEGVVVHQIRDGWAQINLGERAGWVNEDYLKIQPSPWQDDAVPDTIACYGTEPFWSLAYDTQDWVFTTPDGDAGSIGPVTIVSGRPDDGARIIYGPEITAIITPEACNDGMSDQLYSLTVRMTRPGGGMMRGCCTLAAQEAAQ